MITPDIVETVINFVKDRPRTVQEISKLLKVNWRTADNYIRWIEGHDGVIATRTFRGGTRGALKIVYYRYSSGGEPLRKQLYDRIMHGITKDDFDFLDIYELVSPKRRKVFVDRSTYPYVSKQQSFFDFISNTKENLYMFSGNVSWINLKERNRQKKMYELIERLLTRDVNIKVLARVDVTSIKNIEKLMSIDNGRALIQVRHYTQPLRGFVRDDNSMRFKSVFSSNTEEIQHSFSVFYRIDDKDWVEWIMGIFWKMYSIAVPYGERVKALEEVKRLL